MELLGALKQFLESSTIHGLVYLSTERKLSKLFWIIVVIAGFSYSGYLIQGSISNWSESPIKTIIETRPISELTFPKVTVCPPKNTFTDLNYDLLMVQNKTMTNETKQQFVSVVMSEFHNSGYYDYIDYVNMLEEDNRAYNLYHAFSTYTTTYLSDKTFNIGFGTSASSGVVKTQYFAMKFEVDKIATNQNLKYYFAVQTPPEAKDNSDYTLTVEIDSNLMNVSSNSTDDLYIFFGDYWYAVDQKVYNITSPGDTVEFELERYVTKEDVENNMHLKSMPGFKVTWKWNKNIDYATYKDEIFNSVLRRLAYIIEKSDLNIAEIWHTVREAKLRYLSENFSICIDDFSTQDSDLILQLDYIDARLGFKSLSKINVNVTNKTMENAEKMILYLYHCNSGTGNTKQILQFFEDLMFREQNNLYFNSKNLVKKSSRKVHDMEFESVLKNSMKFQEEKVFYYWYIGSNYIRYPYWNEYGVNVDVFTSASSGKTCTQYYGEPFDPNKIEKSLLYSLFIFTQKEAKYNPDYKLSIEVKKIPMKISIGFTNSREILMFDNITIYTNDDRWIKEIEAPANEYYKISIDRSITQKDISNNIFLKKMPGFCISWKYNYNLLEKSIYHKDRTEKLFRR